MPYFLCKHCPLSVLFLKICSCIQPQRIWDSGVLRRNIYQNISVCHPFQQDTPVSYAAVSFLCYFAIFVHDPVPNDSKESCYFSTAVTSTAETSVVSVSSFHPTKTHLGGGSIYVIIFKLVAYCSYFDLKHTHGQQNGGQSCAVLLSIAQNGPDKESLTCHIARLL